MADLIKAIVRSSLNVLGNTTFNSNLAVQGDSTFDGDILVGGNLNVSGTTTIINSTTVSSEDQLIELGAGRTTALTSPAGFYVPKYDGTNSGALVFDKTGTAYVGDVTISNGSITNSANLQPLATRPKTIADGSIMVWNNSNTQLQAATNLKDTKYLPLSAGNTNCITGSLCLQNNMVFTKTETDKTDNSVYYKNYLGNTTLSKHVTNNGDYYNYATGNVLIYTGYSTSNTSSGLIISPTLIRLTTDLQTDLGTSSYRFNNIFANTFIGTFSGNASSATYATSASSASSATSATKASKVAINNAASTSSYNLLLTSATTNTTEGTTYVSPTNTVKYNVATGAVETKAYKVAGKATMQYNEIDDCIEFVFA